VERIARALGRPARLVRVPPALMRLAGTLLGRRAEIDRLLGDLAVAPARLAALGFRPPFTVDAGLDATAAWFRSRPR
jgi:UDP-glucose 4-epimerase